jgi:peptidylprolyl isomerase/FKBP-type peptidyl-prolyl cis-trans isomerase FkpA
MKWLPATLLAVALAVVAAGCGEQDPNAGASGSGSGGGGNSTPWAKVDEKDYKTLDGGLKYAIIKPGSGPEIKTGQQALMHYTGWLKSNGKKFDSSRDHGQPFPFPLGQGAVIPGWDKGVVGMKQGEQRQLVIPAALGYGDQGTPDGAIPPGADLVFDVELMGMK